ncbi:MAG: SGNH/GDSL hydrolase family protein [Bryobacteraceae bacterium]
MKSWILMFALAAAPLAAQDQARMAGPEALALFNRAAQLVDSTSSIVPGLVRAAAPVLENTRQAVATLERTNPLGPVTTYELLSHLRAYLSLADALPKPYPFPDAGRKQFVELREAVDRIDTHLRALLSQTEIDLRSPDRDNLARYREVNERLPKATPGKPRVVFLGDSITDGWRLNEYFPGRDFVNRGIGGQITGQMLGRLKADVLDLQPQAVVLLAGTNDLARGVSVEAIRNNITVIAELLEKHRIRVLLASVLPVSDYHKEVNPRFEQTPRRPAAKIKEINEWMKSFCAGRGFVYVDYYSAMMDGGGYLTRDMADDGLHPNAKGYRVMASIVLEAIDRTWTSAPVSKAPPAARKKRLGIL